MRRSEFEKTMKAVIKKDENGQFMAYNPGDKRALLIGMGDTIEAAMEDFFVAQNEFPELAGEEVNFVISVDVTSRTNKRQLRILDSFFNFTNTEAALA